MMRRLSLLVGMLVLVAAVPASAQRFVALGMPDSEVLAALQKFQKAIATGDRAMVAGMANYPVRVNRGPDEHTLAATRAELLKRYDAIFTPAVRSAIGSTNLGDVLGGIDGVALGRGAAWFTTTCNGERGRRCRLGLSSVNLHTKK